MRMIRFAVGRALIHAGLAVMPPGHVKDELYDLLKLWGDHVTAAVAANRVH
jgi:hypothetical protein